MISNFFKKSRNRNLFIFVGVLVLTVVTISVSYASFFSVKTNSNNQVITTGTLDVSFANNSSSITKTTLDRMSDTEGMQQTESSVVYIQNSGNLDSVFTLNVGYNLTEFTSRSGYSASDKLVPIDYIMFAVYEYDGTNDNLIVGPIAMSDLPIYTYDANNYLNNRYSLILGSVGNVNSGNATKTYKIKTWLSDKAVPAVSYSYFYVNLEVVAEVEHSKMSYSMRGIMYINATPISGAIISLQNGSIITTTNEQGEWLLEGIYPGVYNFDLLMGNDVYRGNLTVEEESNRTTATFASLGSTATGSNLWSIAKNYGTTVQRIIDKNNLTGYSETITPSGTLNLFPTYKLTAGSVEELIDHFKIRVDFSNKTYTMSMS